MECTKCDGGNEMVGQNVVVWQGKGPNGRYYEDKEWMLVCPDCGHKQYPPTEPDEKDEEEGEENGPPYI